MSRVQSTALWSCMVGIAGCLSLGAQAPSPLSSKLIADAIELGTYGEPTPYLLRHAGGRTPNPVIIGAIYTPYLRVALAAKAARAAGGAFTEADVAFPLIEPVFYVAFRWYCCDVDQDKDQFNPFVPLDYKVAHVPARGPYPFTPRNLQQATPPTWIRRDVSLLESFGALPYGDIVLVAAYPMDALTMDKDFVIYRGLTNGMGGRSFRVGRLLASERAAWR